VPIDYIDEKKSKTETVTFRLSSDLIDELKKDAEIEGVSLNSYVAKIFANHVQWERYERKVGLLPMTESFLKGVLDELTEEQVVYLAREIEKKKFKDMLAFMKDSHDVDEFIEVLRSWLTVSWMQHNIVVKNGAYSFKIRHNLGEKWSLYVKTLVMDLAHDVLGKKIDAVTMGPTLLSLKFSK